MIGIALMRSDYAILFGCIVAIILAVFRREIF
jgi:hypothetical protein